MSGGRAYREGCAGCGAPHRGRQAVARASAARADSPGRPGAPIGLKRTNQRPRLSLQRGCGLNSRAAAESLGPRLAASTKRAGGRSAALLRLRASQRADTPALPNLLLKNALSNANVRLQAPRTRLGRSLFPFSNYSSHLNGLSLPESRPKPRAAPTPTPSGLGRAVTCLPRLTTRQPFPLSSACCARRAGGGGAPNSFLPAFKGCTFHLTI